MLFWFVVNVTAIGVIWYILNHPIILLNTIDNINHFLESILL